MQTVNDIRKAFLDFFREHGHTIVPSSPLVPRNDPSLMFTSAGMVQFKNVFTGVERRDYTRASTAQKCVRAGGKHNDLENVGYTGRHHTFFEMLGNFSFGDYFKELAIELAWTLVTKGFGLHRDRLLITVYAEDEEAFDLWRKIAGLPSERILKIPTLDNFWSMGDTGPCGPCAEIFYDHGDHLPGGPPGSPDEDGDRFVEIWNLVFMQYEQVTPGRRLVLPKPSIDTGMGLERMAAILQGTHDNYEIDLFKTLIEASAEATGTEPGGRHRASHRVIADHLRAVSFLIADGVMPSNEGRGYVLRRIMRRAMRHAHLIGSKEPLLWRLVPTLVAAMGQAYPELVRAAPLIAETLKPEETRFKRTLERGLRLLDEASGALREGALLDGETAFRLYDTYGFPLDLTEDALRGRGIGVDTAGFEAAMQRQREEARSAWAGSGETADEEIWFTIRQELGATDFLGYETERAEGQVVALLVGGERTWEAGPGDEIAVVVNQSPFYGEAGGQVGDTGLMTSADGARLEVLDTKRKVDDLLVHHVRLGEGTIRVGDDVALEVDSKRRGAIRANHSVTHLLHEALHRRLGAHVTQKGSLVAAERMRFDLSHPKAMSADEIADVERDVNARIRANSEVVTRLMEPEAAIEAGAMALFGEKYGDEVRVVTMGGDAVETYSTELCGGTHVRRTGDIGVCKIVSEGAVAAGVRRIEVVIGAAAEDYVRERERVLGEAARLLKVAPEQVGERIAALVDDRRRLERELAHTRRRLAAGGGDGAGEVRTVGDVRFRPRLLDGVPAKDLKNLADDMKREVGSGVVAVLSVNQGKASLVVGVTDDLTDRFSAVDLVRAGSEVLGGGGGGRPNLAQAGGPEAAKGRDALAAVEAAIDAAG